MTDVHEEVEEARVERLGEGVSGETRLLRVQGHGDGLRPTPPLAVHDPAGELRAEAVLRDAQQEAGERQD